MYVVTKFTCFFHVPPMSVPLNLMGSFLVVLDRLCGPQRKKNQIFHSLWTVMNPKPLAIINYTNTLKKVATNFKRGVHFISLALIVCQKCNFFVCIHRETAFTNRGSRRQRNAMIYFPLEQKRRNETWALCGFTQHYPMALRAQFYRAA